jgi:hypothetical protein
MRKSFWIVLALLIVASAPVAHADTFAPTFTCTPCVNPTTAPTAPDVTFPSPTMLDIDLDGLLFAITLPSGSLPGDKYNWSASTTCSLITFLCNVGFFIVDQTQNTQPGDTVDNLPFSTFVLASGELTFTSVAAAPEPSSLALIPLGLGALLVMRKRLGHSRPSAV